MLYVITSPRVVQTLQAEIESSKPTWLVITNAEAREMPYLQAVIKEGLRVWPSLASLESKDVPKGGDRFNNIFLSDGTRVGLSLWGTMRRVDIWGVDAEEFRPERWLEAPAETLKVMQATLDLVFYIGKWQCLGKNVALLELNKVFVEVSDHFFVFIYTEYFYRNENAKMIANSSLGGLNLSFSIRRALGFRRMLVSFYNYNSG